MRTFEAPKQSTRTFSMIGAIGRYFSPGGQGESSTKTPMDGKQLEGARPITPEDTQFTLPFKIRYQEYGIYAKKK